MTIELVHDWGIEQGAGVIVNGEPLGIAVGIEGPMVEAIDEYHHILWMPLIAEGPAPRVGRPEGEPTMSSAECRCPDDCDCDGRFACEAAAANTSHVCELVVGHPGMHHAGAHNWDRDARIPSGDA